MVLAGYQETGIQLIGYDGTGLFPSGMSDDSGMYYVIPKLVRFFGISLEQAIDLFFYGMIIGALVLGLTGFFLLSKSWFFRIIATGALSLFYYSACRGITDVYLVSASIAIAIVPPALYFIRNNRLTIPFCVFTCLSGIGIGTAHYLRAFSSVAVFIFLVLAIFLCLRIAFKKKVVLCGLLLMGTALPFFHFNAVLKQRNNYLGQEYDNYASRHVFWHSLYAGFGFLNNDFGIAWNDSTVINKIKESAPDVVYPTKEYEAAVKVEFFKLIRHQFHFVLVTLFAKLGVIFYYLFLFANIGLLAAFFYRKPWKIELSFWSAICFNSLFGFMALPGRYYLLGMLAFALLYGLFSIEHAIANGVVQDVLRVLGIKRGTKEN